MEKLHKSKSEICLSQFKDLKETFLKKPLPSVPKHCPWKKILPGALRNKCFEPQTFNLSSTPILPIFINNNYSNIKLLTHEGDIWLRESSLFKKPAWRKKRFVLLEDKLHCYETKKGVVTYSGLILKMSQVISLALQDSDCIKISHIDGSTSLFRCNSTDERNSWLTALLAAKAANLLKYQ